MDGLIATWGGRRQSPSDAPGYVPKLNVSSTTRTPFSPLTIPRKMENGHNSLTVCLLWRKTSQVRICPRIRRILLVHRRMPRAFCTAVRVRRGAALTVCHFLKGRPSVSIVPGVAVNPVRWPRSRSWSLRAVADASREGG